MLNRIIYILLLIAFACFSTTAQDVLKLKNQKAINVDVLYGDDDFFIIHNGLIRIDTIARNNVRLCIINDIRKKKEIERSSLDHFDRIDKLLQEVQTKYTIINNKIIFIDTVILNKEPTVDTLSFFEEIFFTFFRDTLSEVKFRATSNESYNWNIKQVVYSDFSEEYKFRPKLLSHYEFSYNLKIQFLQSNELILIVKNGNIKYFYRNSSRELMQKSSIYDPPSRIEKLVDKNAEYLLSKAIESAKKNHHFGIDVGDDKTNKYLHNFSLCILENFKNIKEALK